MPTPTDILDHAFQRATIVNTKQLITDTQVLDRLEFICRNIQNRAGIRLLLACLLAKVYNPKVDIRKPYTEIGGSDAYSGRTYDEAYLTPFINKHQLPCNPTTAFLTPALRNRNTTLTPDLNLETVRERIKSQEETERRAYRARKGMRKEPRRCVKCQSENALHPT